MKTLPKVDCKYGAPMGRCNNIPYTNESVKLHLRKLQWIDGDYDEGGAYWGCGGRGQNIYWAYGESGGFQGAFQQWPINVFVRAVGRNDAKQQVKEQMPNVSFYR